MTSLSVDITVTERGRKANTPKYSLERDVNGQVSLVEFFDFIKSAHLDVAIDVLRREQINGFTQDPRIRVDGSFNKRLELVKPFGKIEFFDKQNVGEVLEFIYEGVLDRSRIRTGNYLNSNIVFYNGTFVARTPTDLKRFIETKSKKNGFKAGDRFTFINVAPYARKLELEGKSFNPSGHGKNVNRPGTRKNKQGQKVSRPNGAYYKTYLAVRRKFKQSSGRVRFSFRPAEKQSLIINSGKGFRSRFISDNRPYVYPSITFTIDSRGILT